MMIMVIIIIIIIIIILFKYRQQQGNTRAGAKRKRNWRIDSARKKNNIMKSTINTRKLPTSSTNP
jgi:uncharacterized membrane protein